MSAVYVRYNLYNESVCVIDASDNMFLGGRVSTPEEVAEAVTKLAIEHKTSVLSLQTDDGAACKHWLSIGALVLPLIKVIEVFSKASLCLLSSDCIPIGCKMLGVSCQTPAAAAAATESSLAQAAPVVERMFSTDFSAGNLTTINIIVTNRPGSVGAFDLSWHLDALRSLPLEELLIRHSTLRANLCDSLTIDRHFFEQQPIAESLRVLELRGTLPADFDPETLSPLSRLVHLKLEKTPQNVLDALTCWSTLEQLVAPCATLDLFRVKGLRDYQTAAEVRSTRPPINMPPQSLYEPVPAELRKLSRIMVEVADQKNGSTMNYARTIGAYKSINIESAQRLAPKLYRALLHIGMQRDTARQTVLSTFNIGTSCAAVISTSGYSIGSLIAAHDPFFDLAECANVAVSAAAAATEQLS